MPKDRWYIIKKIIEKWQRPLTPIDGLPLALVEKAERRLGFPLPVVLKEWYLLAGQNFSIANDPLLLPDRLIFENGLLIFWVENQWVVTWGIAAEDLDKEDPPVFLISGPSSKVKENTSLSEFILQMVLHEITITGEFCASVEATPSLIEYFEQSFPRLDLPDWHWPVYPTRFHGNEDVFIHIESDVWIWVVTLNQATLSNITEQFDTAWIYPNLTD